MLYPQPPTSTQTTTTVNANYTTTTSIPTPTPKMAITIHVPFMPIHIPRRHAGSVNMQYSNHTIVHIATPVHIHTQTWHTVNFSNPSCLMFVWSHAFWGFGFVLVFLVLFIWVFFILFLSYFPIRKYFIVAAGNRTCEANEPLRWSYVAWSIIFIFISFIEIVLFSIKHF